MPRKSKLPRYREFNHLPNTFGPRSTPPTQWRSYLKSDRKLHLELGCGRADISLQLAKEHPRQNYVGIDLKADRLWAAAKLALEGKLSNIAFIQSDIAQLTDYFDERSIASIWLAFPDPYPKKRHHKRRLLNNFFLDLYKLLLINNGVVHFKTDDTALFEWSHDVLSQRSDIVIKNTSRDLHNSSLRDEAKIITTFERRFIARGIPISYLDFRFTS